MGWRSDITGRRWWDGGRQFHGSSALAQDLLAEHRNADARLARAGDSEPVYIEDAVTAFTIGWNGRYRID